MTKIRLPDKIRVGFRDFKIEAVEHMDPERFGECDVNRSIIRICTDYDAMRQANTLIHEAIHAAWSSARLGEKETEEKVATHIADQLCQIWRDNPSFVTYVSAAMAGAL